MVVNAKNAEKKNMTGMAAEMNVRGVAKKMSKSMIGTMEVYHVDVGIAVKKKITHGLLGLRMN
jgi:hypothetical protein